MRPEECSYEERLAWDRYSATAARNMGIGSRPGMASWEHYGETVGRVADAMLEARRKRFLGPL